MEIVTNNCKNEIEEAGRSVNQYEQNMNAPTLTRPKPKDGMKWSALRNRRWGMKVKLMNLAS